MYERFTDRARKVMQLANQEAMRLDHESIETEHILLGLIKEGSGVAAHVLKNREVNLDNVRKEVERMVQGRPANNSASSPRLKPRAKNVIGFALEECRNLNHHYAGTEHLLLGLLREEDGVAAKVLTSLGLTLEQVREDILRWDKDRD